MSVRFRIHENKTATLAGVDYQDLRSVFDAAAINYYEDVRKLRAKKHLSANDRESLAWLEHQLKVLVTIKQGVEKAIDDTFPPKPALTKAQRLAIVQNEKKERELIDGFIKTAIKQRSA